MKKLLLASAAIGLSFAAAGGAQAALVFNGSYGGGSESYIGTYNPTANDSALFSLGTLGLGAFTNTWVFDVNPAGNGTVNANFVPGFPNPNSISNFTVELFNASGTCSGATFGAPGTCTGFSLGSSITTGIPLGNSSNIGFTPLAAGLYAFVVTGTVVSTPTLYSGQLTTSPTPAPEPASLALLGAGLLGLGAARRARR